MFFTSNLNYLINKKGYKKSEYANLINVSRQALNEWTKGNNYPKYETLIKISDTLGVSIDDLLKKDLSK